MERTVAEIAEALCIDESTAIDYFSRALIDVDVDGETRVAEDDVAGLATEENERRGGENEIARCPGCNLWFDYRNRDNPWDNDMLCEKCFDRRAFLSELGVYGIPTQAGADYSGPDDEEEDNLWEMY